MTSTSARQQEKLSFRTFLLLLHRQNPSWSVSNTADFLEQSENPPNLNRHSLMNKINYLLNRGSIDDRRKSGRRRTTTTTAYQNIVLKEIQARIPWCNSIFIPCIARTMCCNVSFHSVCEEEHR
jgi:hypothetical protein